MSYNTRYTEGCVAGMCIDGHHTVGVAINVQLHIHTNGVHLDIQMVCISPICVHMRAYVCIPTTQTVLLDGLEEDLEGTQNRLAAAQRKVNSVLQKAGAKGQLCIIVALLVLLVILIYIAFS